MNNYGFELQDPAWDVVLSILEAVTRHVEKKEASTVAPVVTKLHETLCTVEQLIELGQFNGNVRKVFSLIEMSSNVRPVSNFIFALILFHFSFYRFHLYCIIIFFNIAGKFSIAADNIFSRLHNTK